MGPRVDDDVEGMTAFNVVEVREKDACRLRRGLVVVAASEVVGQRPLRLDQLTYGFGEPEFTLCERVANRLGLRVLIANVNVELAVAFSEQSHHLLGRFAGR